MTKTRNELMTQYLVESLKKGDFLNSREISENENIDVSPSTYSNRFGSLDKFQFELMCEVAMWTKKDRESFIVENNLETKWDKHTFNEQRLL